MNNTFSRRKEDEDVMDGTYDSFCRPGFVNSIKKLRSDLMGGSKVLQGTD